MHRKVTNKKNNKMSLKKPGQTQTVEDKIQQFSQRLNNLDKLFGNLHNSIERRNVRNQILNMKNLDQHITSDLETYTKPNKADLEAKYSELKSKYLSVKSELETEMEKYEAEERERQEQREQREKQDNQPRQMSQLDMETQEINNLNAAVSDIVEDQKAIAEATEILNSRIQDQHEIIIRVDNTVEKAEGEMEQANKELDKAKEHQAKCRIF